MIQIVLRYADGTERVIYRPQAPRRSFRHEGTEFDLVEGGHEAFRTEQAATDENSEGRPTVSFWERATYQEKEGDKAPRLVSEDDLPW